MSKDLVMLMVCNGMTAPALNEAVNDLKSASKGAGTHKRREFYWKCYGDIMTYLSGKDDKLYGCITYQAEDEENDGKVEFEPFTKYQKGLIVNGAVDIMAKKFKPVDDPGAKEWFTCFFDDDAQAALEDITSGEPVVFLSADGVFTATRYKKRLCKGCSVPKTMKDLEKLISELEPDKPLVSVGWHKEPAPKLNDYNFLLAGPGFPAPVLSALPDSVVHVNSTSPEDVYNCFLARKNMFLMKNAEQLIEQMLTDVQKGEKELIHAGSMKHAAAARENSLMKKVYVHEDKQKFITKLQEDGEEVEVYVIRGDVEGTKFADYGSIVFEMYYRADLDMFV